MPLTEAGIYYADTSTTMSIADITAAMATSVGGALTVLQVVNATTSTVATSSVNTYSDTGLTATITPKYATSKILVIVHQAGLQKTNSATYIGLRLLRGGTILKQIETYAAANAAAGELNIGSSGITFLDTPATTTATTYKTQFNSGNNTASTSVQYTGGGATSSITLMEIAA